MKNVKRIFIIIVFITCIVPAVFMFILGESESGANETRVLKPHLLTEEGGINLNIFSEYTDYIGKRFALRQEFITLNSLITTKCFGVSPVNDVIFGQGGWLYYNSTVNDFLNKDVLSEAKIEGIADKLEKFQLECSEKEINFLFVAAPNKNTIYPEYMPYLGESYSDKGNMELLFEKLSEKEVSHINLKEAFQNKNEILYHKTDSHWNNLGAAKAADEILKALNHKEEKFFSGSYEILRNFEGDLYRMLYPKGEEKDENVVFSRKNTYSYNEPIKGADSMTIKTSCEGKSGSLLVFRDSFGNALYPFLAESFNEAVFLRRTPYSPNVSEEYDVDTIIIVMAERNLSQFDKFFE